MQQNNIGPEIMSFESYLIIINSLVARHETLASSFCIKYSHRKKLSIYWSLSCIVAAFDMNASTENACLEAVVRVCM